MTDHWAGADKEAMKVLGETANIPKWPAALPDGGGGSVASQ